ncbi:MAG TPA: methanogenesis marker protein Mmp4/MtxX [Methanospirillum sp.]|uniref:methanogenesis marker protein Mmp4/MtxX n=1 Tax=Methanospirillum sp. TaxID=45200 RepID=UPI002CF0B1EC|nr:methanogenesis marker protein Mmp4/MtxX [Methanospirillum sp.]HWQ62803.1 methanogenesis marker protein Mmp4/MtxX [Methanospirillum sp.]
MPQDLIGIGVSSDPERVIRSIINCNFSDRVVCYTDPDIAIQFSFPCLVRTTDQPGEKLVSDLETGQISAAVRGTLPATQTLSALKLAYGVRELERIVLLESAQGKQFFLAPVGIDEGWTVSQKISLIKRGNKIAIGAGLSEKVGVLSGGRLGDAGRHPAVDRSMADAELVSRLTGAMHYEILIEDAIAECGLIIAPDGITGNLIFRTLLFAGNGVSHGAPVVNIGGIFVDTSRVNPDYSNALNLAASMNYKQFS